MGAAIRDGGNPASDRVSENEFRTTVYKASTHTSFDDAARNVHATIQHRSGTCDL